ncbi:hypothetical protein [Rhizobium leguminosarum]|uniref:hypothetical protein n=1 Tax=Rhizobium leguminosarum TaxID=384 RepID=UPI003F959528
MGDRQTSFIAVVWLLATLLFFVLIGFRIWDQGFGWFRHSAEPLVALGVIALSCYLALMFSEAMRKSKDDRERSDRDHQETMGAIRALYAELSLKIDVVESAVYDLERKMKV